MRKQIIRLSDNAAERIKFIMSKAESSAIGVRVGVKTGGCAGMSYMMEYANEAKPNEEVIEEKESVRFLKSVQNLKNLKPGQLDKLNIVVRKSKLKRNLKKGIF